MTVTILTVDDSATMRKVLEVYLMGRDYSFVEASDGERAMLILRTLPVDLVIADVHMPGMDGVSFVRQLRATEAAQLRNIPVVLLTVDRSPQLEQEALSAGVDAFLLKPVDERVLTETVEQLLARRT